MKRGRPGKAVTAKGVCGVCRTMRPLLNRSGKVALHGRTAAAPRGCAGSYQPPLRKSAGTAGTVVGFRPGDAGPAADPGPVRAADLDIEVTARHPQTDWRTVRPPDGPAVC